MNTRDNWLTTATIHDEHRRAVWSKIFPGAVLPIKSPLPSRASLPGHPDALVYFLDLAAISAEQREQLVEMIADLFCLRAEEVREDLAAGVPILADDVSVETRDRGILFTMIDGEESQADHGWDGTAHYMEQFGDNDE